MLRRFNSLIKGPKGQTSDSSDGELHVSLRPALSVDSSLFSTTSSHVNPLQQQLARLAREEVLFSRRPESNGQTSAIARVPEEKFWKEGYEHGIVIINPLRESPEKTDLRRGENSEAPVRVLRTSSDAVGQLVTARSTDLQHSVVVDVPDALAGSGVDLEAVRKSAGFNAGPGRTISSWSTDSAAEHCRICQQHSEEPLIDLGCLCRGEMAKSHKSCIELWFKNKGTNKCEVCQHIASNIPAPPTLPAPHFWVWRLGGPYGAGQTQTLQQQQQQQRSRARLQPLWAALAILIAGLLFDVLVSIFLGASALPVNIIIGVLVVLGLGTAVRLVLEYLHERAMQRRIQLLELDPVQEDLAEGSESSDQATPQNGPSAV